MRDDLIPTDPLWTPSRALSLLVSLVYLVMGSLMAGWEGFAKTLCFLVLPLACIWFSEILGDYTGWGLTQVAITKESPGVFVLFIGWLVLLLPVILAIWFMVSS